MEAVSGFVRHGEVCAPERAANASNIIIDPSASVDLIEVLGTTIDTKLFSRSCGLLNDSPSGSC
jgi:hypothetical protein